MRKRKLAQNYGKVFVIFYFFKCQAVVVMQELQKKWYDRQSAAVRFPLKGIFLFCGNKTK
jgi:hypothetical protein